MFTGMRGRFVLTRHIGLLWVLREMIIVFKFLFIYFERERERRQMGEGQREREREGENPKQAPPSQCGARREAPTQEPRDRDLS